MAHHYHLHTKSSFLIHNVIAHRRTFYFPIHSHGSCGQTENYKWFIQFISFLIAGANVVGGHKIKLQSQSRTYTNIIKISGVSFMSVRSSGRELFIFFLFYRSNGSNAIFDKVS